MIGWIDKGLDLINGQPAPQRMPASLFTGNSAPGLENLPFDLLINESHGLSFDITDHSVGDGGTISDHVTERLRSVNVTGLFTNNSIKRTASNVSEGDGSTAEVSEDDEIKIAMDDDGNVLQKATLNTAKTAWERLVAIARARQPVRLITSVETYGEMIIQRLDTRRGPDDGEGLKFTMTLREIRTAKLQKVTAAAVWNPPDPAQVMNAEQRMMMRAKKNGMQTAEAVGTKDKINKVVAARGGQNVGG